MTNVLWTETNRANWDDRASVHLNSGGDYYDLAGVVSGRSSLRLIERDLAGDVAGRRVLHLMCHIGLDSISWARLGARVTAIDFSPVSISAARCIASECGVDVDFFTADVHSLPETCSGPFSVVVMTYGVLVWIRDFAGLARMIAERLEHGGRFVLVDGHPITNLWSDKSVTDGFRPREHSYFGTTLPERRERLRSYGGAGPLTNSTSYQWQHHVSEVVQAITDAGLRLRTIREEPFGFYRRYPGMVRRADGYLDPPPGLQGMPLLLAIMAERA